MLCALIMAGGKGERFWPMSTEEKPKQFLNLLGKESMIQLTVKRLVEIIPIERIFIVTAERYVSLIKEHLPELPDRNIILEPEIKNTAPCIAFSAFYIREYYEDATLVVLPSDHLILNEDKFRNTLLIGEKFIENNNKYILTIGINPTRPDTGYGYIKTEKEKCKIDENSIISVESFKEKPCLELAEKYIKDKKYLWNSGMFIWKASTIIEKTKELLPDIFTLIKTEKEKCKIEENSIISVESFKEKPCLELAEKYIKDKKYLWNSGMFIWKASTIIEKTRELLPDIFTLINNINFKDNESIEKNYSKINGVSVDYGIMEKSKDIYVIPGDFGWDDLGSWNSLSRYKDTDKENNVIDGSVVVLNSKNNIIQTNKKTYVMGIENLLVIETDNEIMIVNQDDISNIKELKKCSK